MKNKYLAILLLVSILVNVYLILFSQRALEQDLQELEKKINDLEKSNAELNMKIYQDNISLETYASTLNIYRLRIVSLESKLNNTPTGLTGFAELQAPAVMQKVEYIQDYPFIRQRVVEEGSMINISVEIKPGKGRVLVQTKPLMGVVFQDAANTAVFVAQRVTGKGLSGSDIIFSIEGQGEVPSVDGPSAGALMTLLTISSLKDRELKHDITLTGTIDENGHVGRIGGVIEKAQAAKDAGKRLILLPSENSQLVRYTEKTRNLYGITIIEQVPEIIDAKNYIETNVGIQVAYIDTVDDILQYAA